MEKVFKAKEFIDSEDSRLDDIVIHEIWHEAEMELKLYWTLKGIKKGLYVTAKLYPWDLLEEDKFPTEEAMMKELLPVLLGSINSFLTIYK